jgi:hypothetical protein
MIDVGNKAVTLRMARASARLTADPETIRRIREGRSREGGRRRGRPSGRDHGRQEDGRDRAALPSAAARRGRTLDRLRLRCGADRGRGPGDARPGSRWRPSWPCRPQRSRSTTCAKSIDQKMTIDQIRLEEKTGGTVAGEGRIAPQVHWRPAEILSGPGAARGTPAPPGTSPPGLPRLARIGLAIGSSSRRSRGRP